jgi:hypothetical protein
MSGIMIGSFGSVFVSPQVSVKIPGLRPPDGNPVVSTGAAGAAPDAAGLATAEVADAEFTATTDDTAAAEAAARTTTLAAAITKVERGRGMALVNVRLVTTTAGFTFPKQSPSTTPTFG